MFQEGDKIPANSALPPKTEEVDVKLWEDVVKTLQLRINDLESTLKTTGLSLSSPENPVSAFWSAIQAVPETQRQSLLQAALEALEGKAKIDDSEATRQETKGESSEEQN